MNEINSAGKFRIIALIFLLIIFALSSTATITKYNNDKKALEELQNNIVYHK